MPPAFVVAEHFTLITFSLANMGNDGVLAVLLYFIFPIDTDLVPDKQKFLRNVTAL